MWFADANGNPLSGRQLTEDDVHLTDVTWVPSTRELSWTVEARLEGESVDTLGFLASALIIIDSDSASTQVVSSTNFTDDCNTSIEDGGG